MKDIIKKEFDAHIKAVNSIHKLTDAVGISAQLCIDCLKSGGKILICGNGGSAHTASHFITDWKKMYNLATGNKMYAHALTDNIGLITAYANDVSYDEIFSEQLKPVLNEDDLVICVSGSGNSRNIIKAIEYANSINADTLGVLGYDGGLAINKCKHKILVNCFDMQLVEDFHLQIGHMVMKSICNSEIVN